MPGVPEAALEPELALALFVAPVLLDAAYDASPRDLRDNWVPVGGLVLGAVGPLESLARAATAPLTHALLAAPAGLGLANAVLRGRRWTLPAGLAASMVAHALYGLLLGRPELPPACAALLMLEPDLFAPAYWAPIAVALGVMPLFALQDYLEGVARSQNWVGLAIAPPYLLRQTLMMGCMIETSVGITTAAHLAPLLDYADLDGAALLAADPYRGATIHGGVFSIPSGPGLGVTAA